MRPIHSHPSDSRNNTRKNGTATAVVEMSVTGGLDAVRPPQSPASPRDLAQGFVELHLDADRAAGLRQDLERRDGSGAQG
jgi:hypothetical protein